MTPEKGPRTGCHWRILVSPEPDMAGFHCDRSGYYRVPSEHPLPEARFPGIRTRRARCKLLICGARQCGPRLSGLEEGRIPTLRSEGHRDLGRTGGASNGKGRGRLGRRRSLHAAGLLARAVAAAKSAECTRDAVQECQCKCEVRVRACRVQGVSAGARLCSLLRPIGSDVAQAAPQSTACARRPTCAKLRQMYGSAGFRWMDHSDVRLEEGRAGRGRGGGGGGGGKVTGLECFRTARCAV